MSKLILGYRLKRQICPYCLFFLPHFHLLCQNFLPKQPKHNQPTIINLSDPITMSQKKKTNNYKVVTLTRHPLYPSYPQFPSNHNLNSITLTTKKLSSISHYIESNKSFNYHRQARHGRIHQAPTLFLSR